MAIYSGKLTDNYWKWQFIVVNLQKAIENGHFLWQTYRKLLKIAIYSGKFTESYWKWPFIVVNIQKAFENGHL